MAFSFLYLVVRALIGLLVRSRRGPDVKDIDLLVLRHEVEVLRRQIRRPRFDRVAAACTIGREAAKGVNGHRAPIPQTAARRLIVLGWTYPSARSNCSRA
jgi:hypothetical protein